MRIAHLVLGTTAALCLAACAATGPAGDPVARKLTWFSYLNGDDLRPLCAPGRRDRIRAVFNADYNEDVRTFEITAEPNGEASVDTRAVTRANWKEIDLTDLLGHLRPKESTSFLSAAQFQTLTDRLAAAGAFDPEAPGVRLPSNGYYWLVGGCHQGRWFLTGWLYPSEGYRQLGFPAVLAQADRTGVPWPGLPSPAVAPQQTPSKRDDLEHGSYFLTQIDRGELVGPSHHLGAVPWDERTASGH